MNKWPKNFDEGPHRKGRRHKTAPFHRGSAPQLIHVFLGPPESTAPNCISIGFFRFSTVHGYVQRREWQTRRQAHRPRNIRNNRPHLCAPCMRCGLKRKKVKAGVVARCLYTTHTFNGPFSGTTQVSRYQKGKTSLDFTEARDSEWQWHQLGHMQVCTLLQSPDRQPHQDSTAQFFTGRMLFLPPSQQRQSTEGNRTL